MTEILIELPQKLSTNVIYRMNHFAKNDFQKSVNILVKKAVYDQKIKPVTEYPAICTYVFYLKGRSIDILNTAGMAKAVEDGLRYTDILKDDSLKFIKQVTLLEEKSERDYSYVTVEIN
jgi:hypothetical protein